ncbi:hypothetical protein ACFX13_002730 [Malus domestica]
MAKMTSFLRNKYWVLRHRNNISNERGIIVSSMENDTRPEYQLAPEGVSQAQSAGQSFQNVLQENNITLNNVWICYSPFSRTTHTAQFVASAMENLHERFFGPSYELLSHDKALDEKDLLMRLAEGGDSVDDVACRLAEAMKIMESQFQRHFGIAET